MNTAALQAGFISTSTAFGPPNPSSPTTVSRRYCMYVPSCTCKVADWNLDIVVIWGSAITAIEPSLPIPVDLGWAPRFPFCYVAMDAIFSLSPLLLLLSEQLREANGGGGRCEADWLKSGYLQKWRGFKRSCPLRRGMYKVIVSPYTSCYYVWGQAWVPVGIMYSIRQKTRETRTIWIINHPF